MRPHRERPRRTGAAPKRVVVPERIDPMIWKIASVVLLGPMMASLDSTVVNVSLASLSRELQAPLQTIQWVTSGYLLAVALTLPLCAWLVDRIGAKRVYLLSFVAFTLASLLCGTMNSAGALIACRVLQGAAGGLMTPMAQLMVARTAGRHVARVMGVAVMPVMLGPILGPALAGVILQHAGWRWIFFINLPIGIFSLAMAWCILPRDTLESTPRDFDLRGFALLSPALVGLLDGLMRTASSRSMTPGTAVELALAAVLLALFVRHALRLGATALLDLGLFKDRTLAAAASTQFLSGATILGGQMLMPLYLLSVMGESPGNAGLLLAPTGIGMLCAYPMMGTLTERYGPRRVSSAGALIAMLATVPFAFVGLGGLSRPLFCVAIFVRGIGLGCINIPSITAAYSSLPKARIAVATTALNIVQRLGGPVGITLFATVLHLRASGSTDLTSSAFAVPFAALCAVQGLTLMAALRLPRRTLHRAEVAA